MTTDLVSHQLVRYLEHRGVKHIFGLCGHTNIAVLAALSKSDQIEFVNTRHEQLASHAADGYARASKKASVVLSHLGPGLTNAATGVANAALDSVPMVVIAGDIPSHYYGKHPHQEVNLHADGAQSEIYRPFVKRVWRVESPHLIAEILDKAFILAESGRPGPVLVDVPMDIFSREVDVATFDKVMANTQELVKPSLDPATAERIVGNLLAAERPLLHVGGGVVLADATDELAELVDHLQLPVTHSLMGKGVVADDNPCVLGMTGFWGTEFVNEATRNADWILALGTRFAEADSSSWEEKYTFQIPDTKLMQIDIDPAELGRNYPLEIGAVADLKPALAALVTAARKLAPTGVQRPELLAEIKRNHDEFAAGNAAAVASDAWPMRPERILAEAREVLPRDAIITTDVGWNKNGMAQQMDILTPGSVFTPGGFATMGFGAPAALGAKLAAPERVVVSLVGDGGFGANPSLLYTAREKGIAVVWVVMNNNAFGTIAGLEKAHFDTTYGTVFENADGPVETDFGAIARAYGVDGISLTSAAEFKPALADAIARNRPVVIDVPMINVPTPTSGHWNIMDIYSPGAGIHHAATS
ncbi:putative acetolactate synthase large subunit [Microlunatus phosphovorus NM-1]|uniref:Putative acetolactate synthase large subunit n=1 Tax=Microlunatus phosphovorus (strain ATCC 700054 / DSM 10555 / JCM 9379 / NBRC 101784 / NCIMB 13414 / VKM Ac-1990 / NM-1) TaxID=1032480 RepID=F5XJN3_MICPN|nr:thiamine pyrophosphate-binding protein [Microlunatus phosphovorus]BAK35933.1 putative acetolactate synthase large subunit [Microlunatus phosphovorus NM-1]